jgi:nucleoside-diphosphate-sugar epimerase
MKKVRIVVFGAGGLVGGWICEELSQRRDVEVVASVRKWASAVRLARRAIDIRRVDLEDRREIPAILSGAHAVVNATMLPPSHERRLVTDLYLACVRGNVNRFIQFSSAAVYGHRTGRVDENVAPSPADDYSRGKANMEARLVEVAAGSSTQLFILRPSIVYGPFSEAWTVRYVERIVKGRWRGLGQVGNGTCNLVHAHDVAKAAIAAATATVTPGTHVLNINGPDVVTWNQYIERLGDALDIPDRITPNTTLFRAMAAAAGIIRMGGRFTSVRSLYRRSAGTTRAAMKNAQGVTKLYPPSQELSLLRRKVHYSADRAARVLGLSPSIPLEEGLRQSVAWCRVHGIV